MNYPNFYSLSPLHHPGVIERDLFGGDQTSSKCRVGLSDFLPKKCLVWVSYMMTTFFFTAFRRTEYPKGMWK